MNEIWWLYLLTRLDNIQALCIIILLCGGIPYGILLMFYVCESGSSYGNEEPFKQYIWFWKPLAFVVVLLTLIPSKNDVAFILAGTGIIETAKSDTAQRLAGKSVNVFEKYLDELLKEEKK